MVANRTRLLLMVVGLMVALVGAVTIGDRVWGQAEDRLITLDLRDASLEDALRLIFKDTPYSFTRQVTPRPLVGSWPQSGTDLVLDRKKIIGNLEHSSRKFCKRRC